MKYQLCKALIDEISEHGVIRVGDYWMDEMPDDMDMDATRKKFAGQLEFIPNCENCGGLIHDDQLREIAWLKDQVKYQSGVIEKMNKELTARTRQRTRRAKTDIGG